MTTENTHKVPNVPPLRFPEFSGEWEKCTLRDISEISKGSGISKDQLSDKGEPCILYGELYTKYKSEVINYVYSRSNIDATNLVRSKKNDIIIPASGETAIDISTARCVPFDGILLGGDLSIIRLKEQDGRYFSYQLNGIRKLDIAKIAQGVSVVHLYGENLKRLKVAFPAIEEQRKIADFINLLDSRIATQNKIIQHLESLITGITQSVRDNATKKVLLADILTEKEEKNIGNHDVYSVSVLEGVINQIEYLGRSFAAKETKNYSVVEYGDIVYTKSPTGSFPYGIVKQSYIKEKAAVSPLYGVYKPVSFEVGYYLHHYFTSPIYTTNYLHKLIQKGAKNTINITNQRFLENYIPLPSPEVLEKYVALVSAVTTKLENEKQVINKLKEQKNYLLSKMFI